MNVLKDSRVLVTGGAGFIGANLVRKLLECAAEVHLLVRPSTDKWRLNDIIDRIKLHAVDLMHKKRVKEVVKRVAPQYIFHLAMGGYFAKNMAEQRRIFSEAVCGTFNLLESVQETGYKRLVHLGSSLEYGQRRRPLKETDSLKPVNFRGMAKSFSTQLCEYFALRYRRPIVMLRLFSVYGYWEDPSRFIPIAIKAFLCGGSIKLAPGVCRHDFVFVEDVIDAMIISCVNDKAVGEVFNIGTGKQWTNEEVIEAVRKIIKKDISVEKGGYLRKSTDTSYWVADISKAKTLLGWEPKYLFDSGLRKTIKWFERHIDEYKRF